MNNMFIKPFVPPSIIIPNIDVKNKIVEANEKWRQYYGSPIIPQSIKNSLDSKSVIIKKKKTVRFQIS